MKVKLFILTADVTVEALNLENATGEEHWFFSVIQRSIPNCRFP